MASLSAFLHPEMAENKEVVVSSRFKEGGKVVPFVIRPITQKENEELLKKYRKVDKQGVEQFNRDRVQPGTGCRRCGGAGSQ